MRFRKYIAPLMMLTVVAVSAQDNKSVSSGNSIVNHIEADGHIVVEMPDKLLQRLSFEEVKETARPATGKMGGYRIQVFSDNNARTAKTEARTRARNINSRFPQYPTYVVYSSPFWRLRVGNFRTQDEANEVADELKEAFPRYSREIRVVRDRVVISGD